MATSIFVAVLFTLALIGLMTTIGVLYLVIMKGFDWIEEHTEWNKRKKEWPRIDKL